MLMNLIIATFTIHFMVLHQHHPPPPWKPVYLANLRDSFPPQHCLSRQKSHHWEGLPRWTFDEQTNWIHFFDICLSANAVVIEYHFGGKCHENNTNNTTRRQRRRPCHTFHHLAHGHGLAARRSPLAAASPLVIADNKIITTTPPPHPLSSIFFSTA